MSQGQFKLAQNLARLAVELDYEKNKFSIHQCKQVSRCIGELHDTAIYLSGDRVGEIYDLTDEVTA
ncbi:MAG: hypothetical protein WCK93_07580 [Nitrosomonadales bacterium]